ncbi:uncharacterized protein [Primulina huaijiensis]|uniref:uncharacterized protein n=1 Tax=Primulina huaijiensis TaxID=1492673 RepID=UPI003CC7742D
MIHLRHSPLLLPYSSGYKQEILIIPYGFRVFEVKELKMKRRNGCFRAVEKDSEFEFDPDKAREALRKLDEQLLSLSKKQVDPPKIRAVDLKQATSRVTEEAPEISGSFLASAATVLFIFGIFYNVLFLTVIKPSIDGEKSVFAPSNTEADEETVLQQMHSSPEIPVVR